MAKINGEMLKIERATLSLGGRTLFRELNMEVRKGEVVCITGDSGCGKTSLLRAILGFQTLDCGIIYVNDIQLNSRSIAKIRQMTAYIPQELSLPHESVREMVRMPFELKGNKNLCFSKSLLWEQWETLGLEQQLYTSNMAHLSGGQRQRILLSVCALLGKPLVIADEPTSALDADCVRRVVSFFKNLAEKGTAILTVSHDRDFIAGCDRVVEL